MFAIQTPDFFKIKNLHYLFVYYYYCTPRYSFKMWFNLQFPDLQNIFDPNY